MNPSIEEFFQLQQQDTANNQCCDSSSSGPLWASVSHGIYISIEAAGVHRSLGVRNSFVLSLTLDNWQPKHLRTMELGGNRRFHDFMSVHGISHDMPIREKYSTRAAAWYRENLRAEVEGTPPPPALPFGTGHLPLTGDHSDPAWAVLDRVFASLQYRSDDKRCCKRTSAHASHGGAKLQKQKEDAKRCSMTDIRVDFRTKAYALQRSQEEGLTPSLTHWLCEQLLQSSEGQRRALKLHEMSTGNMQGFGFSEGHDTSPVALVAK